MQFVIKMFRPEKWLAVSLALFAALSGSTQINSPYSRYGLGDLANVRNVTSKAMGGLAAAYSDYQSVNFLNAASYSNLPAVTYDVGIEAEFRTIRNQSKSLSNQSGNIYFNYLTMGMPLSRDKKGRTKWGLAFGIRPYTRINYKIEETERIPNVDSAYSLYEGSGGAYRGFVGTGYRIGNLSLGINAGFLFGQQDISSKRTLLNDTVYYYRSNHTSNTSFNKFVLDGGMQYDFKLSKKMNLRLGVNGNLGHSINAYSDITRTTFNYNANGGIDTIDVVYRENNKAGKIELPAAFSAGFLFEKGFNWSLGAEYERVMWNDYSYYGQRDFVANASMLRFGAQWIPNISEAKNYFKRITYRAGMYTGKDYVVANGQQLPVWGATFGFTLPLRKQNVYSNQYTSINTSFEIGRRGDNSSVVRESFIKVNLGFNLSDIWFIKRKFD